MLNPDFLARKSPRYLLMMEKDGDNQRSPDSVFKIEDFSERITIDKKMNIGIFWDVEDYPFPDDTCADEMYEKIKSALDSKEGLLSIWAYFDGTKETSVKYLGDKTWKSRLYFIASGNKRARLTRMFNDIMFWKLDVLPAPAARRLFVCSDGVKSSDDLFYQNIKRLGSIGITTNLYTLASKDHQPGNPQWTQLRGDHWVELVPDE